MQQFSIEAWLLGVVISVDEQTMEFKGMYIGELRITYKNEGDGFQRDALCPDGYTFTFYFRHQLVPKKYLDKGLLPLHSCVISMFDCLRDKHHRSELENFYMSTKSCRESFNHNNKIRSHCDYFITCGTF